MAASLLLPLSALAHRGSQSAALRWMLIQHELINKGGYSRGASPYTMWLNRLVYMASFTAYCAGSVAIAMK